MDLSLAQDEIDCIKHLMGRIGCRDTVIEAGPLALVGDWTAFVARCEKGFASDRDAFLQDLSVRTMFERLLGRLPRPLAHKLRDTVREADFRYRSIPKLSTEFVMDARLARRHPPDRDFWLYGWPETVRAR